MQLRTFITDDHGQPLAGAGAAFEVQILQGEAGLAFDFAEAVFKAADWTERCAAMQDIAGIAGAYKLDLPGEAFADGEYLVAFSFDNGSVQRYGFEVLRVRDRQEAAGREKLAVIGDDLEALILLQGLH